MPLRLASLLAAVLGFAAFAAPASAALHLSSIGDFTSPVYVTAPPGDPHRVFVVEQAGKIIEVRDGQVQDPPFLDITSKVKSGGEQGLLSMAFAPDYATSGRYYVYYTAPRSGDSDGSVITVEEFSPAEHHNVVVVDHPVNGNHNGGQIQFGPDGMLYVGTGDGGSGNDPPNNAQNLGSNLGKILRLDPLSTSTARLETFAYGLRNPFRFSFDRQTGDLTIGDVGQNAREEVDFSPKGTAPGVNYGWRCWEGTLKNTSITPQCDPGNDVKPVLEKDHSGDGFCAIIGGYVVRDASLGSLAGRYVYGDNCAPGIRSVTLPAATNDSATGLTVDGLSSFGEDSCGHLYAASLNGPVYRIDGDSFSPCPESPPGAGGTPPGGGTPPPPDTTPPVLRLSAWPSQHALRNRGFWTRATCNELCGVNLAGTMRIQGSTHVYKLKRVARLVSAGRRQKIMLGLWSSGVRALRGALRRHRHVSSTLSATALDAAKNRAAAQDHVQAVP